MPDVRVVLLLPAGADSTEPVEPVEPAEAARRATTATAAARNTLVSLWAVASAGRPQPTELRLGWDVGNRPGVVLATAEGRHEGLVPDVHRDVASVREQLMAGGWTVAAHPVGNDMARLVATLDDVRLVVAVWGADGPWDVTTGAPAHLGDRATAVRTTGTVTVPWGAPAPEVAT